MGRPEGWWDGDNVDGRVSKARNLRWTWHKKSGRMVANMDEVAPGCHRYSQQLTSLSSSARACGRGLG